MADGTTGGLPMREAQHETSTLPNEPGQTKQHDTYEVHGVRYQVTDVARAAAFYTEHFGFRLEHQQLPAFASVSLGDLTLLLSGPGASGSRPLSDGVLQVPG